MNVIGDIAGNFLTLKALLAKMPDDVPVSLGDMCDRGPRSKEVLEFFMANGRAIMGNHEHMMLDYYLNWGKYELGIWQVNGGGQTKTSFEKKRPSEELLFWMAGLPFCIREGKYLLTHAPIYKGDLSTAVANTENSFNDGDVSAELMDRSILWNRYGMVKIPDVVQVYGHNSHKDVVEHTDSSGPWAYCIDTSKGRKLTGFNTNTGQFYSQDYID